MRPFEYQESQQQGQYHYHSLSVDIPELQQTMRLGNQVKNVITYFLNIKHLCNVFYLVRL